MMRIKSVRLMSTQVHLIDKVPLTLHGIDGRYATALFSAASKQNVLDKVESDLKNLKSLLESDKKVGWFLDTPTIDRQKKQGVVKVLLEKGKYGPITANFLGVLAENGRLNETGKIITAYQQLMVAVRGEVSVVVTSAQELDQKTLTKIKDSLLKNKVAGEGKKLVVSNKVNPQIIGGLIVEIGDKTIDMSVSSKITKLNTLLTQAV